MTVYSNDLPVLILILGASLIIGIIIASFFMYQVLKAKIRSREKTI